MTQASASWYADLSATQKLRAMASPAGLARIHTRRFAPGSGGRWELYPYMRLICEDFMPVLHHGGRRMLFMPPRHGKSLFTSCYTSAWFLLYHKTKNVIITSYSGKIAEGFSKRAQAVVREMGFLFGARIHPLNKSVAEWQIQYLDEKGNWVDGGFMYAAGVDGGLPGRGAELIIMDDVVRGQSDCTPTLMQKAYEWWISVLSTREQPLDPTQPELGGAVILVMTRWAAADLAGRIIDDEGDDWEVRVLPALAKKNDPLGRLPGEALCEERFPRVKLEKRRDSSDEGGMIFEALYQQDPLPDDGAVFKPAHLHRWEAFGDLIQAGNSKFPSSALVLHFVTIDPALKKEQLNDPTGFLIWALAPLGELILLEDHTARMAGSDDLLPLMRETRERFPGISFFCEDQAHGTEVMRAAWRLGLDVVALKADRDKVTRAIGAQPAFAAARVFIPAVGSDPLVRELLDFPGGRHDDRVDCVSYAVQVWRDRVRQLLREPDQAEKRAPTDRDLDPDAYLDEDDEDAEAPRHWAP
ncbi:MAG: hypothetical protein HKN46_10130 [Acidimicrobiia bacterium]|nr:hypothetical protein [Acidimicrobiia bacterium]